MNEPSDPCASCGGGCCSFRNAAVFYQALDEGQRYDSLIIDRAAELVTDGYEAPDMEWYVLRDPDGNRHLAFHCGHLEDGLCSIYEDRPNLCRQFECAALEGEQTLDEWWDETGWGATDPETWVEKEVTGRVTEIIEREAAELEAEHG